MLTIGALGVPRYHRGAPRARPPAPAERCFARTAAGRGAEKMAAGHRDVRADRCVSSPGNYQRPNDKDSRLITLPRLVGENLMGGPTLFAPRGN